MNTESLNPDQYEDAILNYCAVCGQLFTLSSGSQKCCPVCAPDAITRRIRERTRKNAAALKAQKALDTSPDGVL